ncbi:MAG: hypothetical protein HY361_02410 [Candidatus Aenigmarchaeota archaeon]|nr:hypothetical protein [Candidatus Aenigmarchaeota archaeon]
MAEFVGVFFALIAALAWGSSFVPLKLAGKVDNIQYNAFVGIGIFLSTLLSLPLLNFTISFSQYGLLSGAMWALGNVLTLISVRSIGISKATPMIGALIILSTFLTGVLFFKEQLTSIALAMIGVAFLIFAIPLIIATKENKGDNSAKGIIYAAMAGVIFGSYITPLKLSGTGISEYIFSMVSGILMTSWVVYLLSLRAKRQSLSFNKIINSLSSGIMWTIGNITSLLAINSIGLSIGFPLTQLQLLINVGWGIFYFKEVKGNRTILKIIIGSILLLIGAVLLALSK